ncbi:MAG TPA: NADH-quinone oxidoreductase subunit N [Vicinamibacterales bacterium]
MGGLNAIVPMACVTAAGIAAMIAEAFRDPGERMPIGGLGIVGLVGAAIATVLLWGHNTSSFGVVSADNFGLFVTGVLVVVGLLSIAISGPTIDRERLPAGEYYALMMFALAGMILMATATDLLVMFLALEVLSISVYVLTGIRRDSPKATEAAFKYFLLGAFSSAFFLYGIALVYGLTGSTHLDRIGNVFAAESMTSTPMQLAAVGLLTIGFAFKVSAVPFHMWAPDAYEGAPPAITGFMSTGVKAAAFAAFVRVFLAAFGPLHSQWVMTLWAITASTMIVGTVVGVAQTNVKRMLAYSSIAHAGYLLLALLSANDVGKGAVLFYLLTYAITNLGAFGVIGLLETADRPNDELSDYAGLWNEHPWLAALMTVFLLSLGGFPPMAGFIAKWYVFTAAVKAGYTGLAILGVLTSVISVFFYLRIVVMMFMTPAEEPTRVPEVPRLAGAALVVCAILIFYLGVLPAAVLDWAAASISTIF